MMVEVTCPSCSELIRHTDRLKVGQKVRCHTCDENLIVLQTNPVKLAWASASDWYTDEMSAKKTTTRKQTKAAVGYEGYRGYKDVDWEDGDREWRSIGRRSRRKKRNQRYDRRRRDESYWDP